MFGLLIYATSPYATVSSTKEMPEAEIIQWDNQCAEVNQWDAETMEENQWSDATKKVSDWTDNQPNKVPTMECKNGN